MASKLGELIVIINNDAQNLAKKVKQGQKPQMSAESRLRVIKSLRMVKDAFISIDEDETVRNSLVVAAREYGASIFAKGGDRYAYEIPEAATCREHNIQIVDGLGDKIQSSSALIANVQIVPDAIDTRVVLRQIL